MDDLSRVNRLVEAGANVRLCPEIVHFVGLHVGDNATQVHRVEQIAIMQEK
jgi:hypothetical protein